MPTEIQWTDETWNCVRGCSRVSSGCGDSTGGGCYAERQAYRFSGPGMPYEGLVRMTSKGPRWTGRVVLVQDKLDEPLRWQKPRRIFVNSMSDLFHEALTDTQIQNVFSVMESARRHIFQVLTKRPARMLDFVKRFDDWLKYASDYPGHLTFEKRFAHVWLGVSVEDQKTADERIPLLLQTPAAVRWISAEPLLGPVDLDSSIGTYDCMNCRYRGFDADAITKAESVDGDEKCPKCGAVLEFGMAENNPNLTSLDWVVVGGESGPNAREFDVAWARSIIQQCRAANVSVFIKQLGAQVTIPHSNGVNVTSAKFRNKKGGDMSEWPEDLRIREFPTTATTGISAEGV